VADTYGQEIDAIYNFNWQKPLGVEVGAGMFMPDDDAFPAPDDEDAMRVWAMLKLNTDRNDE
jgi:hypothetical protein